MALVNTDSLEPLVMQLAQALRACGARMATAESCTGGLIAAACTSVPGSSDWFERGWVTYSNAAKTELLGVPPALITRHGAVSREVALAMAAGALAAAPVDGAVAVTGIAGPGGAVPGKPVGTVWLATAWRRRHAGDAPAGEGSPVLHAECLHLGGDRGAVRMATVHAALQRLLAQCLAGPGAVP